VPGGYGANGLSAPGGYPPAGSGYPGNPAHDPRGGYAPPQQPGFFTGQSGPEPQGGFTSRGGYEPSAGTAPQNAAYRQGTYPESVQPPRGREFPPASGAPWFSDTPSLPGGPQYPNDPQFQATTALHRPPPPGYDQPGYDQPGYDQPGGPGGYAGPAGPGGPDRPGRTGRRRITDAFARAGDAGASPSKNRNRVLVVGAGVLCVVAIGGVILAPRLFNTSDPGCTAYAGPTLTAYDNMVHDLNTQASQSRLSADTSATVTELTQAVAAAHGTSVKSALNSLLSELRTVQTDVAAGEVPASTVNALNADSTTADHAC